MIGDGYRVSKKPNQTQGACPSELDGIAKLLELG